MSIVASVFPNREALEDSLPRSIFVQRGAEFLPNAEAIIQRAAQLSGARKAEWLALPAVVSSLVFLAYLNGESKSGERFMIGLLRKTKELAADSDGDHLEHFRTEFLCHVRDVSRRYGLGDFIIETSRLWEGVEIVTRRESVKASTAESVSPLRKLGDRLRGDLAPGFRKAPMPT